MMKIGCCVNMVAEDEYGIGIDRIETLERLGYDYIELPTAQMMSLDDKAFSLLLKRVQDSGLPCLSSNNFLADDLQLTGPEPTKPERLDSYVKKALERAEMLGITSIVFGSAGAKNIPAGFPYEAAWGQVRSFLQYLADLVEGSGMYIAIEPINTRDSNVIVSVAEGLKLAKEVDRPHIRLLADFYHMCYDKEGMDIIEKAADYLQHMHISHPDRTWPDQEDGIDYDAFIGALKKANYTGGISIEAYSEDFEADAARGRSALKELIC